MFDSRRERIEARAEREHRAEQPSVALSTERSAQPTHRFAQQAVERLQLRRMAGAAWRRLKGGELTPWRAALSVALGLAIGVTPIWGVHWLIVAAVCVPLRLDAPIAYLAANVSLPFVAPFITFAELEVGARVLHGAWLTLSPAEATRIDMAGMLAEVVTGTVLVAVSSAAVGGSLTYAFVAWRRKLHAAQR